MTASLWILPHELWSFQLIWHCITSAAYTLLNNLQTQVNNWQGQKLIGTNQSFKNVCMYIYIDSTESRLYCLGTEQWAESGSCPSHIWTRPVLTWKWQKVMISGHPSCSEPCWMLHNFLFHICTFDHLRRFHGWKLDFILGHCIFVCMISLTSDIGQNFKNTITIEMLAVLVCIYEVLDSILGINQLSWLRFS